LLLTLDEPPERCCFHLAWSTFRRKHQAIARRCHATRRAQRQPIPGGVPTMHRRYQTWRRAGIWQQILTTLDGRDGTDAR